MAPPRTGWCIFHLYTVLGGCVVRLVDEPACAADEFHMAALNLCGDHFGDLVGELVNRVEFPSSFAAGLDGPGVQTVE